MSITEIKEKMPSSDVVESVSELFKVLGDATRSRILFVLEQGPLCVSDISACVDMSKYAVSHQLRILRQSKLVKCKREGKEVIYSLDDEHVSSIFVCALEHILEED
ncbi:MAG: metalloregulator ArsR/SmtB family transcription factor [Clostridia bacterium]|nr:metalloregulator ArsR/SmtB family transcription factor [Clostridia bacterium]